jgi:hypothetical protein
MRVAPQVVLTEDQKRTLHQWARGRSLPARQVERARVVLLAAAGKQDLEIAAEVGISNQKAARWRKRFLKLGLGGRPDSCPKTVRTVWECQLKETDPDWRRMPLALGARQPSRPPKCRKWFAKLPRESLPTRPSGAHAPWQNWRASAKRACAASGTSMA